MKLLHKDLTDKNIKAFYNVYNKLGYGFLEKIYENSLKIELEKMGLKVTSQMPIKVFYDNQVVGEYFADLCVEDLIINELKVIDLLSEAAEAQLTNYLKATDIEVGLLFNFGPKPQFVRKVFSNERKKLLFKSAEIY